MLPPSRVADATALPPGPQLVSLSEEERAASLVRAGLTVVRHRGRTWQPTRPGFFEPIHLLARLRADEAVRPTPLAWGFRAVLDSAASDAANGTVPVHVIDDLRGWDVENLDLKRRATVRRAYRRATVVPLPDRRLLEERGHALCVSQLERTRHKRIPSAAEYRAHLARLLAVGSPLVLVAFAGDRLAGFIAGYAVDGVAYTDDGAVGTDYVRLQVGTALHVAFILACRRSPGIHTVVNGLHARENPGLDEFKEGLGYRVVHLPTRVTIPAPVRWLLRARRPHVLYRLTGR